MPQWILSVVGVCMCAAGVAILRNIDTVARSIQDANDVLVFSRKRQFPAKIQAAMFGVVLVLIGLIAIYAGFAPIVTSVHRS